MSKNKEPINPEVTPEEENPEVWEPEETAEEAEPMVPEALLKAETDKYLRLAAEYDNYKKRSQKEREALFTDVRCDTVAKLLPVYDNLVRALKQETADAAFKKGVEMTMTQLEDIFAKMNVTAIEALGKTFDPNLHNAVLHVDDEAFGENEIVEEFEKGFRLGEKVIRFSVVKVAN